MSRREKFTTKENDYSRAKKAAAILGASAIAFAPAACGNNDAIGFNAPGSSKDWSELYGDECANHPDVVGQSSTTGYEPLTEMSVEEVEVWLKKSAPALQGYYLTEEDIKQIENGVNLINSNIIESDIPISIGYRVNYLSKEDKFVRGTDFDMCLDAGVSTKSGGEEINLNQNLKNHQGEDS